MSEIKLNMRYPESRLEDITDAYTRGFEFGLAMRTDENAKLRELVMIAVKHCDSGTCDGCPIQGESGSCPYSDMARELGVEG